jgi:predicted Zn finger-like uncharacterized protein
MFHVTRCPNCRTSFRVTDAHLAAFDGKVRCGRCAFVFDARAHFVGETAVDAPVPLPAPAVTPVPAEPVTSPSDAEGYGIDSIAQQLGAAADAERDDHDSLTSQSLQHLANVLAQADSAPHSTVADEHHHEPLLELDLDMEGARGDEAVALSHAEEADTHPIDIAIGKGFHVEDEIVIEAPPEPVEEFSPAAFEQWADQLALPPEPVLAGPDVTENAPQTETIAGESMGEIPPTVAAYRPIFTAEDEAMLRVPTRPSPWRWLWSIPSLLALIALAAQLVYHYRTDLSVTLPGSRPRIARFCELAGCKLELPARSELLHTDWSELRFAPDHPNVIQVDATLRNQAPFEQALPLMELTLTDDVDRVVAKKVFAVRAYLAPLADGSPAPPPASMAAGSDLHVFLQLDVGALHSSGYAINWFYPRRN